MAGNTPETRDSLNIDDIVGNIWSVDSTNKEVGIASRSHIVGLLEVINLRRNTSHLMTAKNQVLTFYR